jgi:flagellar basal-body rod protein FlgF
MDRMIYLSMSGAKATMQRQDVLTHNLANVSTVGFRAELQAFRSVPVNGSGASTRVYALESTPGYDATPGPMQTTGRTLDVAMQGDAWMAVQALDGTESYTRSGSLDLRADGTLSTRNGLTVLGDGGPIKLATTDVPLVRGDDGLFRTVTGETLQPDTAARLQEGALEGSNVSAVETMVSMIAAARQFEAQMKMVQTAEANEKAAAGLLAHRG